MNYTPTINKILFLLEPIFKRKFITLVLFMFMGMLLETLGIGLVVPAVALFSSSNVIKSYPYLQKYFDYFGNPSQEKVIIIGMVLLFLVYSVKNLFLYFLIYIQNKFVSEVQLNFSNRLFKIYMTQPYTFHLERNSAHLIQNITREIDSFILYALTPGIIILSESFILLGILFLLVLIEPVGTLATTSLFGIIAFIFQKWTKSKLAYWGYERTNCEKEVYKKVSEGLNGVKDVKVLGREKNFLYLFDYHKARSNKSLLWNNTLNSSIKLWIESLAVATMAFLVIIMLTGGSKIENVLPIMGLFGVAAFRLMPSANRLITAFQNLNYGKASIEIIYTELTNLNHNTLKKSEKTTEFKEAIYLKEIFFKYSSNNEATLKNISLFIKKGKMIGIIGESGAGKSTLVDILLGLLTPQQGRFEVDDKKASDIPREWQNLIGYVSQSIYLSDDSIAKNVAFGLPDKEINISFVNKALKSAQLDEFINELPEGIMTVVGERGVRLSGGQRQRIGIARALYHNPEILILDEATSSLDIETEKGVMDAIQSFHGEKTIIIVAHRLSTVKNCDYLYKLEKGIIVSEGTPSEILI